MADAIKIELDGVKELIKRLGTLQKDIDRATKQEVKRGVLAMQKNIRLQMRQPGKGKPRGDGSFSSKPGDVPAKDQGPLSASVKFNIRRNGLVGRLGTNLKYGKRLEKGIGVKARPWLQPEYDRYNPIFLKKVIKRIQNKT